MKSLFDKTFLTALLLVCCVFAAQAQTDWYDPMEAEKPYINGRAWNQEIGRHYQRLPERFKDKVSKAVWSLSHHTAGLYVKFVTRSRHISVRYVCTAPTTGYPNVVALNQSGVDLYVTDVHGADHWICNRMGYSFHLNHSDTVEIRYHDITVPRQTRQSVEYTLYLPTYNGLKSMRIGVDKGERFQFIRDSQERPIVVYGTSIAHGASASRPGLIWPTRVQRELGYPVINLGFSGSAKMEPAIFDMLSEIDAHLYVIDAVPNCTGLDDSTFTARFLGGMRALRAKTKAPILVADGNYLPYHSWNDGFNGQGRHKDSLQLRLFRQLQQEGMQDLYYLSERDFNFCEDDYIEGRHPNDLGMKRYADAYEGALSRILIGADTMRAYQPCVQRRDRIYEWMERHNEVIKRNRETQPQVVMIGNSITHFWGGKPDCTLKSGEKSWNKLFKGWRVTNMGFGWDRVENVYWRLRHGELDDCRPEHVFLLIGINNVGQPAAQVASGIVDIVKLIRKLQPQARLHVIKPYPARKREQWVLDLDAELDKQLQPDAMTDVSDPGKGLLLQDGSGKIDEKYFRDGLHPIESGYEILAKTYKKLLKRK